MESETRSEQYRVAKMSEQLILESGVLHKYLLDRVFVCLAQVRKWAFHARREAGGGRDLAGSEVKREGRRREENDSVSGAAEVRAFQPVSRGKRGREVNDY